LQQTVMPYCRGACSSRQNARIDYTQQEVSASVL
jgi:hypothetical protein